MRTALRAERACCPGGLDVDVGCRPGVAEGDLPRGGGAAMTQERASRSLDARDAPDRPQCGAPKRDGSPCTMKPVLGTANCFTHAPQLEAERAIARRKGGLVATHQRTMAPENAPVVSLATAADSRRLLEDVTRAVLTGQLAPNIGNSVGYLVSVGLRLAELELSAQVADLERELAARRRQAR
jgi:hypothetical protein